MTGDKTLYAHWTANELTFNAQSKASYYNTAAKTVAITGATNGTGTYTYSIKSQKNSGGTAVTYFTISGTTVTVKASTPVGAYTVVVTATDSNSKKTKDATITITVKYPKLTLNGNSGTVTQAAVYTKYGTTSNYTTETGSTAGTIKATRTGYTLNGWYTAASGGTKVLNADGTGTGTAVANYTNASKQWVMTANQTLYAHWTASVYTITLNNQSATTAGSTAVYEKYATGIYKESGCTTAMTGSANNITVPQRKYTVTFNYNGSGKANTTATATYTFGGYYTATNGGGTQMITNTGYINTTNFTNTKYTAAATLYAKWTGGTVTLPTPTRTGYGFAGWYTSAIGGTKITSTTQIKATQTLYAHWTAKIILDGNGASTNGTEYIYYDSGNAYLDVNCTQKMTATQNPITKPQNKYTITFNYNYPNSPSSETKVIEAAFSYYYIPVSGAPGVYTVMNNNGYWNMEATNPFFQKDADGVVRAYAQWTYTNLPTPTRTGYTFAGWYTAASGGTEVGASTLKKANKTLYAHWTPNVYKITLHNRDPLTSTGTTEIYEKYGVGIYKEQECKTKISNITIPERKYTITYDYTNTKVTVSHNFVRYAIGSGLEIITNTGAITCSNTVVTLPTIVYGKWSENSVILPTPTRANYTFEGWYSDAALTKKVGAGGASYIPREENTNIKLYAKWTANAKTASVASIQSQANMPTLKANKYSISSIGKSTNITTQEAKAEDDNNDKYNENNNIASNDENSSKNDNKNNNKITKENVVGISEEITKNNDSKQSETNEMMTETQNMIYQVKIGDTKYETLSEALSNSKNGEEITLLEDITLKDVLIIDEEVNAKINLNGHKIQSETVESIENYGTIEIIDTSGGKIVGKITNYQDLKIKGGTIIDKENADEENNADRENKVAIDNKTDVENTAEFDIHDTKSIMERANITIDNKKGNVILSGGVVENNTNEGIVIYNSKEGNVLLETGKIVSYGSKVIGILNVEGNIEFNINEEIIEDEEVAENEEIMNNTEDEKVMYNTENEEIKTLEITLNGSNSIGIYNIREKSIFKAITWSNVANDTIIEKVIKIKDGYKVREEEIEAMNRFSSRKEEEEEEEEEEE